MELVKIANENGIKLRQSYVHKSKNAVFQTNKNNFIVGAKAHHKRPHDSRTLIGVLSQIERLTGVKPDEVNVDLGYRGHDVKDENIEVILAHQKRGITSAKKKRQKRRSAIEPIIGHCKNDRKVGTRNWLRGKTSDQINALAMATGFNLRKILRWIFLRLLARWLTTQKIFAIQIYTA